MCQNQQPHLALFAVELYLSRARSRSLILCLYLYPSLSLHLGSF